MKPYSPAGERTMPSPENSKRPFDSACDTVNPSKVPRLLNEEEQGQEEGPQAMTPGTAGSQRYLIAVEYMGTRFSGSQKQPIHRTVAGVLEEAFLRFVGRPVSVHFSSRTDAGVHALSNVCHVDVERTSKRRPGELLTPHEPGVVIRAMNHFLNKNEGDVSVIDVRFVPADFNSRFKALERTYFYRILSGPEPLSTFERERAWHVAEDLDLLSMKKACNILVGHHDFSSFRAAGCQANSPIRTLDELHICNVPSLYFPSSRERKEVDSFNAQLPFPNDDTRTSKEFGQRSRHRSYVITARARSFLYHQVRLMVGVLKSVGTGVLTSTDVERILNARAVTATSPMAPACGLYLGNVKYVLP